MKSHKQERINIKKSLEKHLTNSAEFVVNNPFPHRFQGTLIITLRHFFLFFFQLLLLFFSIRNRAEFNLEGLAEKCKERNCTEENRDGNGNYIASSGKHTMGKESGL
jgi:hypothetical protein